MDPHMVVEPGEFGRRAAQGLGCAGSNGLEQRLQGAEQPFNPSVLPRAAQLAAPMANPERLQHGTPEHIREHRFIVGTDHSRHTAARHRQQQMTQQRQRAFARQLLQA